MALLGLNFNPTGFTECFMRLNKFFKSFLLVSAGFLFSLQSVYSEIFELDDTPASVPESSDKEYALNAKMALSNPDYPVTAGDIYTLSFVAGKTPVSYPITVDTTYSLKIANLGVIKNCDGLTYKALKRQVESLVSKNYPMGAAQFILTSPGVFSVKVTGQVKKASEVNAWALTRLSEIVTRSVTQYSSLRNVKIVSSSGKTRICDLFKASRDGDFSNDPYLRPGDTVEVGRISRRVSISGAVERPGTYELLDGEELGRLVGYYGGGLTERADPSRVTISRLQTPDGNVMYLDSSAADNTALFNMDAVYIGSYDEALPYITMEGIIRNPEEQALKAASGEKDVAEAPSEMAMYRKVVKFHSNENYAGLVRREAGSFVNNSDLKKSYIRRGDTKITIDIESYLFDASLMSEYSPQKGDILVIPYTKNFVDKFVVDGEVKAVTEVSAWPLRRVSQIIADYMTPYSSERFVTITDADGNSRECDLFLAKRDGDMTQNPYVQAGEKITLKRISRRVSISGAVERPGTYELLDGEELGRLVGYYGGGLTERADPSRMRLTRILNENSSGKVVYLDETAITDNYALLCYDSLFVTSLNDINPVLFLQGAVSQKAPDSSEAVVPEATTSINITVKNGTNYASVVRDNAGLFSSVSDLKNAYIIRKEKEEKDGAVRITEKHIPINLEEILYNQEFYSSEYVQNKDILLVPFRQFFVTVAGAVPNPGRYSYIPDRDWSYYVGLAGGIDTYRNSLKAVTITDVDGKRYSKKDNIIPEMTIEVEENSGWYKWNRISGGITAILTILSSTLSILAVTGVF